MPRGKPSRKRPTARGASAPAPTEPGSDEAAEAVDDATPSGDASPREPAATPPRKPARKSARNPKAGSAPKPARKRPKADRVERPTVASAADDPAPGPVAEAAITAPEPIAAITSDPGAEPPAIVAAPAADETMWGEDGPELGALLADAHRAVLEREERRVAERRQAERRGRPPRPTPDAPWLAAAAGTWLLVLFALLSPPAFMRAPAPAPFRPAPALREPSLRYGIWLARQRVEHFTRQEGRLPSFLGEAGMLDDAIRMEVDGERSYRLIANIGERQLVLTDRMAADSFLGNSLDQLRDGE